jgi:predicted RNase H-like HicB family nuclease
MSRRKKKDSSSTWSSSRRDRITTRPTFRDLPGCTRAGRTVEETLANMWAAVEGHIGVMREHNDPIPEPLSQAAVVEVEAGV